MVVGEGHGEVVEGVGDLMGVAGRVEASAGR
jgi:hypothetical protein